MSLESSPVAASATIEPPVRLEYDFDESIGCWMILAAHAYERAFNEQLAPEGMTWRQCQVLGWLSMCGAISQAELADKMRIEPPTVVGVLDRMERDGLIRREACPKDRRKNLILATEAAAPVWARIVDVALRVRARAVKGLTEDQRETLKALLTKVRMNLEAEDA